MTIKEIYSIKVQILNIINNEMNILLTYGEGIE